MNEPKRTDLDPRQVDSLTLSEDGAKRREAILGVLLAEQRSQVELRRRKRVLAGAAGLLALISAGVYFWPEPADANHQLARSPEVSDLSELKATVSGESAVLHYLESNSPTVTDRLVCTNVEEPRRVSLQHIDDDELLGLLEESGKPGTLGIIGGEKRVVFDRATRSVQF